MLFYEKESFKELSTYLKNWMKENGYEIRERPYVWDDRTIIPMPAIIIDDGEVVYLHDLYDYGLLD